MAISKIIVRWSGGFPFDMLRYSAAYPAHESSSASLGNLQTKKIEIELHSHLKAATLKAHVGRWNSFGVEVVKIERVY